MKRLFFALLILCSFNTIKAQGEPEGLGAWYMYFFTKSFGDSGFGIQGDYQFRYWNGGSDLEQILLRTGLTYKPTNTNILLTFGYGNITSGAFGASDATSGESRIYQEALLPQRIGQRILLTHRFRFEQRWVENQDFRSRFRYNLFMNIPFNSTQLQKGTVYLALYNELFINAQRDIGDNRQVEIFDRNRTYIGLGYGISNKLRTQLGWMRQTTDNWSKGQMQVSLHQRW